MDKLTCESCERVYRYDQRRGHTRRYCNSCVANRRRGGFKQRVVDHLGGKCSKCGYDRCVRALHVHHRDPLTKSFNIASAHSRKWERVVEELAKCVLLCANCHAEEHEIERWKAGAPPHPRKQERRTTWPKKELLEELVAIMPLTRIGAHYGVSDNAIRKWCRAYGIDCRRGRGTWTGKPRATSFRRRRKQRGMSGASGTHRSDKPGPKGQQSAIL